jgi:hypothetical protein
MKTGVLITIGIISGILVLITLTAFIIPTMEANHQRECMYDGGKVTGFLKCTRVHMDYSFEPTTVYILYTSIWVHLILRAKTQYPQRK